MFNKDWGTIPASPKYGAFSSGKSIRFSPNLYTSDNNPAIKHREWVNSKYACICIAIKLGSNMIHLVRFDETASTDSAATIQFNINNTAVTDGGFVYGAGSSYGGIYAGLIGDIVAGRTNSNSEVSISIDNIKYINNSGIALKVTLVNVLLVFLDGC